MVYSSDLSFTTVIDLLGTFAFAVSGIRWASTKRFDWFGAYVIGLVTAIGGGTTRDLLLNVTPFWMQDATYLTVTGLALLVTLLFRNRLFLWGRTLFLFDSIGLGLFTVVGVVKSLDAGFPFWVCIMMGAITGSVGGVIRDVLLNEVPLLFRKDIYALACIAGGIVYMICYQSNLSASLTEFLAALTVILIRVVAVRYHVQLPFLKPIDTNHNGRENKE
ncbi:trimeric intracellular cation channel family protein [Botryobacter ruber]|uniref:trimeric intracellular cation channel family protein n=1 Tax=Botryobacter ruber TaxID=2171629 RepID=UPI000E0CA73C|nr:trimeric intracellular cation channel family protein [Botryobacter ruber]